MALRAPQQFSMWTFVQDLSDGKQYRYDVDTQSQYVPFIINKAFSAHIDTLYHASMMNQFHGLDRQLQHDYLFYAVSKKRRWKEYLKKTDKQKKHIKLIEDVAKAGKTDVKTAEFLWRVTTEKQKKVILSSFVYPDEKNR